MSDHNIRYNRFTSEIAAYLDSLSIGEFHNLGDVPVRRVSEESFEIDYDTQYDFERTVSYLATCGSVQTVFGFEE